MTTPIPPEQLDRMRIPRRYRSAQLDQIPAAFREPVIDYVKEMDRHLRAGTGMLLWGPLGAGKTCAAICVAVEARRRGVWSLWTDASRLVEAKIEHTIFDDEYSELLWDRARVIDLLILDDLGKEHAAQSGFAQRILENLIRERVQEQRTTLITTNLDGAALTERYGESLLDLMDEGMIRVDASGPSQRLPPG